MMEDQRPRVVAHTIAHSQPRTVQGEAKARVSEYLDRMTDPEYMPVQTYNLLCDTADMYLESLAPVFSQFDAFLLAYTLHAQANLKPI